MRNIEPACLPSIPVLPVQTGQAGIEHRILNVEVFEKSNGDMEG